MPCGLSNFRVSNEDLENSGPTMSTSVCCQQQLGLQHLGLAQWFSAASLQVRKSATLTPSQLPRYPQDVSTTWTVGAIEYNGAWSSILNTTHIRYTILHMHSHQHTVKVVVIHARMAVNLGPAQVNLEKKNMVGPH